MDNDKEKKKIIISEISFWKSNQLLPAHYCDFLTQLYTEGRSLSDEGEEKLAQQSLLKKEKPSFAKTLIFIITSILIIAVVAMMFLFVQNLAWIPTVIGILLLIAITLFIIKSPYNKALVTTLAYASAALLLFAISVRITGLFFTANNFALFIVLFMNCVVWIVLGKLLKQVYFLISGILGLLIILFYMFFN